MAKAELFAPVIGSIARGLGCFPVHRGEGDLGAVQTAVELARSGYAVGIFPEGTRRTKGLRKKTERGCTPGRHALRWPRMSLFFQPPSSARSD